MKNLRDITGEPIMEYLANEFLDYIQDKQNVTKQEEFQEELDSTIEEFGFTDEAKIKATALFHKAVDAKESMLRTGIANLLGVYTPVLGEDAFDVLDAFGEYIKQLKTEIGHYDRENAKLSSDMKGKLSEQYDVDESVITALWTDENSFEDVEQKLHQDQVANRRPKRSFIDEQLEEINDDTSFANVEEYVTPRMALYLRYF